MKKINILISGFAAAIIGVNDASAYVKRYCTGVMSSNPANTYVAGRISYIPVETMDDGDDSIDLKSGYGIAVAYGAAFDNLRIEGEMKYTDGAEYTEKGTYFDGYGFVDAKMSLINSRFSLMLNGYYDSHLVSNFGLYVGAGVGIATNTSKLKYTESAYGVNYSDTNKETDTLFIYQLGLGASYAINPNVTLDLGYRYSKTSETEEYESTITAHEIVLGARYNF